MMLFDTLQKPNKERSFHLYVLLHLHRIPQRLLSYHCMQQYVVALFPITARPKHIRGLQYILCIQTCNQKNKQELDLHTSQLTYCMCDIT